MQWLQNNWFWLVLAVGFVAMHLFGHGGHRHGHRNRDWRNPNPENDRTDESGTEHAHSSGSAPAAAGSIDPELRALPAHAGHDNSPTPADGKRHRHGC
jgi:hypothetical protein